MVSRFPSALALPFVLAFSACTGSSRAPASPSGQLAFGGKYEQLAPEQKQLIGDWTRRYNEITGERLVVEASYDALPLSTRTTFDAVTHALMSSELTDDAGESLGTALDLVRLVETTHGAIPDVRGDHQLRLYAFLQREAVETLENSREFSRHADNTIYHVDYPINYRQDGTPSIQVSIARDGERADIDVDYRSSAIPLLLFDGHLTSANSDVRAGNNYERHAGRWQGFLNWWGNLFGLPILRAGSGEGQPVSAEADPFPSTPRIRSGQRVDVAVEDFLSTWLVQRTPEKTIPYFSARSYGCVLELEPGSRDTSMATFRIARDMKEVNLAVGSVSDLGEALDPIVPEQLVAYRFEHPYEEQFALFDLPAEVVDGLECHDPEAPLPPWHESRNQKFYGASMRLSTRDGDGFDFFTIWTPEEGYWKMVAFHLDLHADALAVAGARPPEPVEREYGAAADPELAAATESFFTSWLIGRRHDEVIPHLSERALECITLFSDSDDVARFSGAREFAHHRLDEIAEFVGAPERLEEATAAFVPWDPELHVLSHEHADAYALLSFSDHHAEQLDCRHRAAGRLYHGERERSHGTHFGTMFQLRRSGEHSPIVVLLWVKEDDEWKIVSYDFVLH